MKDKDLESTVADSFDNETDMDDRISSVTEDSSILDMEISNSVNFDITQEPLSVQSLIAAGAGFGHKNIHVSMRPFVYSETATGCLINMDKSFTMIKKICEFLEQKVAVGYKIIILGDKNAKEFSSVLANYSKTQMVSYIEKHRGGVLTNFQTLHASIVRYKDLLAKKSDLEARIVNAETRGSSSSIVASLKKMLIPVEKEIKDKSSYEGLKYLNSVERCIFITPSIKRSKRFIDHELIPLNKKNEKSPEKHSFLIGLADSDSDITSAIKLDGIPGDTLEEQMAHYSNYSKYVWPVFANDDKFASVFMSILSKFFESINLGRIVYEATIKKRNELKKAAAEGDASIEKKPFNNGRNDRDARPFDRRPDARPSDRRPFNNNRPGFVPRS